MQPHAGGRGRVGDRRHGITGRARGCADGGDDGARVGQVEELRAQAIRVVGGRPAQLEVEQPRRLLRDRVRVLGADDDAGVRPRLPRRGERGDRRGGRGVLDVPVPVRGQAEQLREPAQRHLLELLQRRRRAPEEADLVQRRRQQLREDARRRRAVREVREEARALPVRDRGHEHVVEVAQDIREGLALLGRGGREAGAQRAGLDLGEHRQLADPLQVRRGPLQRVRAVASQVDGRLFRSFSICFHVRVFTTSPFVNHARRAWPTPNST